MESLETWFSKRDIFANVSAEMLEQASCQLSDQFWFLPPTVIAAADGEIESPELARCDLENLAYVCCPGLSLQEELERGHEKGGELDAVK